ncbi:MAG: DUF4145 domain-containing protein [Armatimonadetes bacterium]|nr:DUF4145 domain-containing protein [Armatimonadota bacterium]
MFFQLPSSTQKIDNPPTLNMRCPSCSRLGSFRPIANFAVDAVISGASHRFSQYVCPNESCRCHLFVVFTPNKEVLASYPPERIDFDATDIPVSIRDSLEETLTCHSNGAFVAAAILVRRTLELLCHENGAAGKNLSDKLKDLRSKVTLSTELLDGLDHLRMLGNDAAHVESKSYDSIGKDEVEIAIEVTKEVLKSLYQHRALVNKLSGLKKTPQAEVASES